MTAPFIPGGPTGYPQQPVYPQPPAPQQGPPPIQYAQNPGYAPPPAYPQYAPQAPPLPPVFQGADLNARLSGPGIPQELQGKSVAEGIRYYGIMREEFIRLRQAQAQQQPLQGQPQAPLPPQQFSAQPRAPQQGQPPVDPMRQYITEGLREVLPEMLAPLTQPMQQRQVQETYAGVRQRYPDWQNYEADIMQSLQGATPVQLANPEVLEAAYFYAKGRAQSRPQGPPQAPGYQPAWPGQQTPQYAGSSFQAPPQAPTQPYQPQAYQPQPYPPQSYQPQAPGAFVEGPTPPAPQTFGPNGQQNDPRDEIFAKRFNVPVDVYRSWKLGQGQVNRLGQLRQPTAGGPAQQGNGQPAQPQYAPQAPGYPQGYPPQQFAPQGSPYATPVVPGYFQPSLNGEGYGQ